MDPAFKQPAEIAFGRFRVFPDRRELLANGPVPVPQIEDDAKAAGMSWATVRRAAEDLGIVTEKAGYADGWAWRLPEAVPPGEEIEL